MFNWKRIKEKLFSIKDQEDYVCLVFKCEDKYYFEKKEVSKDDLCKVLVPVFIKLHLLSMVEEDIVNVGVWCAKEYGIITDKIQISYNVMSLVPVRPQNYYSTIVTITERECDSLEGFEAVPKSTLLLKRDSNIFFEMVAKEIDLKKN